MENTANNKNWYLKGLRNGIPIAMGYFAVSFTLGITMKNTGITPLQGALMSMTMLASAGQYAAITVFAAGSGFLEMVITTLIVNLRYLLMSCALSQKVDSKTSMGHRLALSYCITDEIFGAASLVEGKLNPFYSYGMVTVACPGWTIGTFLGVALGTILPERLGNAMGVALYGMFLAVIIPPAKKRQGDCLRCGTFYGGQLRLFHCSGAERNILRISDHYTYPDHCGNCGVCKTHP